MGLHRIFNVILLIALSTATVFAEDVRLVVGGGLLGRIGGFCEKSDETSTNSSSPPTEKPVCSKGTAPLGGALGLSTKLGPLSGSTHWIVLSADNFPKDFIAQYA